MIQNVSWSNEVKWITLFVLLLLVGVVIVSSIELWTCLTVSVMAVLAIVFSFYFAPDKIEITGTDLILYKLMGKVVIPLAQIREARLFDCTMSDLRLCGSGGVMGYTGLFTNKEIGRYVSYIGDYRQTFMIRCDSGKKYVFSCSDRVELIKQLRQRLGDHGLV